MSTPIKTNQIICNPNYEEIDKNYDIFAVQTTETYFQSGACILDTPFLENNVCSVLFDYGKRFYVLMKKDNQNQKLLQKALSAAPEADSITLSAIKSSELYKSSLLQLLLNSLGSVSHPALKFNNLTGHLYCCHSEWIFQNKDGTVWKIPCLELKITPECRIRLDVRTFTSVLLKESIKFSKRRFEDYPKYIYSASTNTLRRKLKNETEPVFIQRQTDGERTSNIDFFDIYHFEKSKMGILAETVVKFNDKFRNMAELDFDNVPEYMALDGTNFTKAYNKKFIREKFEAQSIRIVDMIQNDNSKKFCNEMQKYLLEEFGLNAKIGKIPLKNYQNFCVIHEKAYYPEGEDPYQKTYSDIAVQHITIENFKDMPEHAVSTVIHEILIKSDLKAGQIRLFDWSSLSLTEDILFGIAKEDNHNAEHYFFMCIHPDGTFSIREQEPTLFEQTEYSQCADIFQEFGNKKLGNRKRTVEGIIKDNHGNINVILDTTWITIPEIFKIREELAKGNTSIRNKQERERLLTSIIDIKYFSKDGSTYYFSGQAGNGMDRKMHTAVNIREIQPYKESALLFEKLLPLMNVNFVRNNQMTVLPFPFKYLREYAQNMITQKAGT